MKTNSTQFVILKMLQRPKQSYEIYIVSAASMLTTEL